MSQTPQDLQKLLSSVQEQLETVQKRREIAEAETKSIELRNAAAVRASREEQIRLKHAIDEELANYRDSAYDRLETLESEIALQKTIQADLMEQNRYLSQKLDGMEKRQVELRNENQMLMSGVVSKVDQEAEADIRIEEKNETLDILTSAIKASETHINELGVVVDQKEADIELLNDEEKRLQDEVLEADEAHKYRLSQNDREYRDVLMRLNKAIASAKEVEARDDIMRRALANKQLELEKREQVVKKRELRAADLDNRADSHNDFMKL